MKYLIVIALCMCVNASKDVQDTPLANRSAPVPTLVDEVAPEPEAVVEQVAQASYQKIEQTLTNPPEWARQPPGDKPRGAQPVTQVGDVAPELLLSHFDKMKAIYQQMREERQRMEEIRQRVKEIREKMKTIRQKMREEQWRMRAQGRAQGLSRDEIREKMKEFRQQMREEPLKERDP